MLEVAESDMGNEVVKLATLRETVISECSVGNEGGEADGREGC